MRDPGYLQWVRELPCYHCGKTPAGCAHHRTGAGMARRASDYETIPLCHGCHMAFHDRRGDFRDMTKARAREWQDEAIAQTRARFSEEVF